MACAVVVLGLGWTSAAQPAGQGEQADPQPAPEAPAAEQVKLPGITIDKERHRIDLDAKVCLAEGLLELIACTPDSKEHESLVVIDAAPVHVHAALLLLGAKNGNPVMATPANEEKTEWVHHPPRGDAITITLVYQDEQDKAVERPISDFLSRAERDELIAGAGEGEEKQQPPAKVFQAFLFAGSQLVQDEQGRRRYVADESGNVISISSFGDEVLCLPSEQSHANDALVWEINPEHLPKKGARVKLRLTLQDHAKKQAEE